MKSSHHMSRDKLQMLIRADHLRPIGDLLMSIFWVSNRFRHTAVPLFIGYPISIQRCTCHTIISFTIAHICRSVITNSMTIVPQALQVAAVESVNLRLLPSPSASSISILPSSMAIYYYYAPCNAKHLLPSLCCAVCVQSRAHCCYRPFVYL